jgi:(p)ppGpp synthase/HD superfamily hydrolase
MADKCYSKRFRRALKQSAKLHERQTRKGSDVPYMAHLMHVSALVWEAGGSEDQAIAALLHDAVEDQGGPELLDELRERYGKRVARIVADCSDSDGSGDKLPWGERKTEHLRHLENADAESLLVVAADKVHNVESIIASLQEEGSSVWDRFNAPSEQQVWYYQCVWEILSDRLGAEVPLIRRLDRGVGLLSVWAAVPRGGSAPPPPPPAPPMVEADSSF